jgi:hypothetical protein
MRSADLDSGTDCVLGVFGKLSTRRVHELSSMTFGLVVQKFLNIG